MEAASPPHLSSSNKDFASATDTIPLCALKRRTVPRRPFPFAATLLKGLPRYQKDSPGSPPARENQSQFLARKLRGSLDCPQPSGTHRRCLSEVPDPSIAAWCKRRLQLRKECRQNTSMLRAA